MRFISFSLPLPCTESQLTSPPTDQYLRALQRGCFRYFQLGLVDGPAGLLGGLIQKPSVLFVHFFSVALLSLWVLLREYPPYLFPVALFKCIMTFWTACVVIFPYMLIEA